MAIDMSLSRMVMVLLSLMGVTLAEQTVLVDTALADTLPGSPTAPAMLEQIDTVWIDDTVWVNDPAGIPVVESACTPEVTDSLSEMDENPLPELRDGAENIITVRGRRRGGRDESARVTVVEGDRVRETARSTPLEELSQESGGIYVSSRGAGLHGVASGSSGGVYIRGLGGFPNSQILIVEDGVPDYQGIFGHPIPDAFFPSLIDRVVVVKGGDGVLYGTNAMGGVIVIENRWPESNGVRFENGVSHGSFNTFRERATLFYAKGRTEIASAFSAFSTDGHRDGADGNSTAGQIGVRWSLPGKISLTVKDKIIRLEGGDPGPDFHPYTDRRFEVVRNNLSGLIDISGKALRFHVIPWANAGEHRLYDGFFSRDYTAGATAECSGDLFDKRIRVLSGVAGEYVDGEVRNRISGEISPVEELSSGALYSQITAKPGAGITGVCGGRLHTSSRYGTVPLYKAGVTWDLSDHLTLHSRIAKNFRQPTLRELYLPFPVANPDLRQEIARNFDAGADVRLGRVRFSGSVFSTHATDMIKYFGVWPSAEVVNIDEIEIRGIESELTVDRLGPFTLSMVACWQDVGRYTKQNPEAKVNGSVRYAAGPPEKKWLLSVSGEWVHGLYMNNYRRDPMDDVFFMDGSVRYRTVLNGVCVEPYCIARNLLDSPYEYIRYYRMPGFNLLVGLEMKI